MPETAKNFCHYQGYLVDSTRVIPSDPTDYDSPGLPVRGCSRLRCPACSATVRSVPGVRFSDGIPRSKLAELYELAELSGSPLLSASPLKSDRLYFCRCTLWVQSQDTSYLGDPDPDAVTTPRVPWRCSGHPLVELPHSIDGLVLTPESVAEVARQALRGTFPAGAATADTWGSYWIVRLHDRLAQTPYQAVVRDAVQAALTDADAGARMRSMHFHYLRPVPGLPERALALLQGDRHLFADLPDPVMDKIHGGKTLEHSLWLLVEPLLAAPGAARELAKQDALSPGKAHFALYAALVSHEPDWVAAQLDALVAANPSAKSLLARALRARLPARIPKKPLLDRLV